MKIKKRIAMLLLTILCVINFSNTVCAYDKIDEEQRASLMVMLDNPGMNVSIYRVGDITSDNQLYLSHQYEKYSVILDETTSEDSGEAALALDTYFRRDNVKPLQVKTTNELGNALFEDLKIGVYLVSCEYKFEGEEVTIYSPMLFSLPMRLDGKWEYNISSDVKHVKRTIQDRCIVYKAWNDDEIDRPEEITVQLLKDGVVFDEQILNAQNSWRYAWNDLEKNHVWSVIEKEVPKGYTLGMAIDGNIYVLENTSEPRKPEGSEEEIPQTGQVWWPVYGFSVLGISLILAGILNDRIETKTKEG